MPTSGFIAAGPAKLHYLKEGSGKNLLIAFHGYGNNAGMFLPLASRLGNDFTTISIDLPHHGQSIWKDDLLWTKKDVVALIHNLMQEFNVEKIAIAGYSLGGRVCLTILEQMPETITKALLVAPDGLTNACFYRLVTRNPVGKRLFLNFLEKPAGWLRIADWLKAKNLLHPSLHKFFMQYVSSIEGRKFLKSVWPGLKDLMPNRRRIRANVHHYKIPFDIFMGRFDPVIPPKQALDFAGNSPEIKIHILDKGHRLMDEETVSLFAETLLAK